MAGDYDRARQANFDSVLGSQSQGGSHVISCAKMVSACILEVICFSNITFPFKHTDSEVNKNGVIVVRRRHS